MNKFLLSSLIALTICYPGSVSAMNHDDDDLILSKQRFLISGVPYNGIDTDKGVMTLCFKKMEKLEFNWENAFDLRTLFSLDHASLVFEYFSPQRPKEIALNMVHFGKEDDCCGFGGVETVKIDSNIDTLKKLYRSVNTSLTRDEYVPATYTRYASWIISNDELLKGMRQAEKDAPHSYPLRLISKNPSLKDLEKIEPGELGIYSKNGQLYCKTLNQDAKQIPQSKNPKEGLHPDAFKRILKAPQKIEEEDKKALLYYAVNKKYISEFYSCHNCNTCVKDFGKRTTCITYVGKIMQIVGLKNLGSVSNWSTFEKLKLLVDKDIKPQPNCTNFPPYIF